jgi:hypothetical protein
MSETLKPMTTDDGEVPVGTLLDYSNAVRGKYFERAMRSKNLVRIDDDLLNAFPTSAELNAALRGLIEASSHVHINPDHNAERPGG